MAEASAERSEFTQLQRNLKKIARSEVFTSQREIQEATGQHPYSHLMRQAWRRMNLQAILCVDNKPTVYFSEFKKHDADAVWRLYLKFWNQGLATLLVVATPGRIAVFSGLAAPPGRNEVLEQDNRLVETIDATAEFLAIERFVERVRSGSLYQQYPRSFDPNLAVDKHLLTNLEALRDRLADGNTNAARRAAVHVFLMRLVFTCYLLDRRIIGETEFAAIGASGASDLKNLFEKYTGSQARDILFRLFRHLQQYFNGSVFDRSLSADERTIKAHHIDSLKRFLCGDDLRSGQTTLGFWAYDFNVIPVETISSIYESFVHAEGESQQQSSGSFYTPRHLAEMVVDVATKDWPTLLGKKFLDPACGSGIFLVILFNRIAEHWRHANPNARKTTRAKALIEIMQTQLWAVDSNETACRIACFSLYLALLDQLEPVEIHELHDVQGTVLPNILSLPKSDGQTTTDPVVYNASFFDASLPLPRDFDLVIGNPPWISRGAVTDPTAEEWCFSTDNPFLEDAPKNETERKARFIPQKQIAHAFMWKIPLHLGPHGLSCLLLPTKLFLNKTTNAFQSAWFSRFTVDKIIQLADFRFVLFEKATCPCLILRARPTPPTDEEYSFPYEVPKVSHTDPRKGAVVVMPEDHKTVALSDIRSYAERGRAPVIWKTKLWASPRDERLLERLMSFPSLDENVGEPREHKRLIKGQGFQPSYTASHGSEIWWDGTRRFLDARNPHFSYLLVSEDCEQFRRVRFDREFTLLRRNPDETLFEPPLIAITQGFSRVAFIDFPVIFTDSVQSIAGKRKDREILAFLTALLNSPLAKYFLFHTSANWGTERDKVHLFELLRLPFVFPEEAPQPQEALRIVNHVAGLFDEAKLAIEANPLSRGNVIQALKSDTIPLVYDYFGLTQRDRILIEDTDKIIEQSSTPGRPSSTPHRIGGKPIETLRGTSQSDRRQYAELLCEVLNNWAKRSTVRVSAETIVSSSLGQAVVMLSRGRKVRPYVERESDTELEQALTTIQEYLEEHHGRFSYHRGLSVFLGDRLYIVKPLALRHWTRTTALNEADEIATAILSSGGY